VNDAEVLAELKTYVVEEFLDGRGEDFDEQTPLLEWGIIDSISVAKLTAFVRERFGIDIPQEEIVPPNLVDLSSFAAMLRRLQPAS
jgi:acyl carrier protein